MRTNSVHLLRSGRGLLLDLADNVRLRERAAPWRDRIDVVTAVDEGSPASSAALLVRPDGHLAWAAPGSHRDLPTALTRWFGPANR